MRGNCEGGLSLINALAIKMVYFEVLYNSFYVVLL